MEQQDNIIISDSGTIVNGFASNPKLFKWNTFIQTILGIILVIGVISFTTLVVVFFTVRVTSDPPIIRPDYISVYKRNTYTVYVLINDQSKAGNLKIRQVSKPLYGTARIVNNGQAIEYQAPAYYSGIDQFNYTAANQFKSAESFVIAEVLNNPPVALNFTVDVPRNAKRFPIPVFSLRTSSGRNISDADGDILAVISTTRPTHGTVQFTSTTIFYTPTKQYSGLDSIRYNITDFNSTDAATIQFNVINTPPVAVKDTITIPKNRLAQLDVLSNDYDPNEDPITILSATSERTKLLQKGKYLQYIPKAQLEPYTDTFSYTITDPYNETASANVALSIVNSPPVAYGVNATVFKNSKGNRIELKYTDFDEMDEHVILINTYPKYGTVELTAEETTKQVYYAGSFYTVMVRKFYLYYTPMYNSVVSDTIKFVVSDGFDSGFATVRIRVQNQPPIANPDFIECQKNLFTFVNVLENDMDPNGDDIALYMDNTVSSQKGATVTVMSDRRMRYSSLFNFTGVDSFNYTIRDLGDETEILTASSYVVVTVVNTPPVAVDDQVVMLKDSTTDIDVLANDYDINEDPITIIRIDSIPEGCEASIVQGVNRQVVRFTSVNEQQSSHFSYTIADSDGATSNATVYINMKNSPPVAYDDFVSTLWNRTILINALANDTDANAEDVPNLRIYDFTEALIGTVVVTADGWFKYTPKLGIVGTDFFTYRITDGYDVSQFATVFIVIYNNPPVTTPHNTTVHWRYGASIIDILSYDYDPDGDRIAISGYTQPTKGSVSQVGSSLIYQSSGRGMGLDSFDYTITDYKLSANGVVFVALTNTPPIAHTYSVSIHWSQPFVDVNVFLNDTDPDNDPIYLDSISKGPPFGKAGILGDGIIRYWTPDDRQTGVVTIEYLVNDVVSLSNVGVITVAVTNKHKPQANNIVKRTHWRDLQENPLKIRVYSLPRDADGDSISLRFNYLKTDSGPIISQIEENGVTLIQVKNTDNWKVGTVQFSYTLSDGLVVDNSVGSITVNSYNNPPVAKNYTVSMHWSKLQQGLYFPVLEGANDTDYQDRNYLTLVRSIDRTLLNADVVTNITDGKIYYKPREHVIGTDTFTYRISDGLNYGTGYISVTVENINTIAMNQSYSFHWKTVENGTLIDVLSKLDNSTFLSLVDVTNGTEHGGTCVVMNNQLFYQPAKNFLGIEECVVWYQDIEDPAPITVSLEVTNTAPEVELTYMQIHWRDVNGSIEIDMKGQASDPDGDGPLSIVGVTPEGESAGSVSIYGWNLVYTPPATNFVGVETFSVFVFDGIEKSFGRLSINITNDVPVTFAKQIEGHFREVNGTIINVMTGSNSDGTDNDYDPNDDPIKVVSVGNVSNSDLLSIELQSNSGNVSLLLTPQQYETNGIISFVYRVTDGASDGLVEQRVFINLFDNPPIVQNDTATVHWKGEVTSDVLANDFDVDDDHLSITGAWSSRGAVVQIVNNKIHYTSPRNFTGIDSVRYGVTDGLLVRFGYLFVDVYNNAPEAVDLQYTEHWRLINYNVGIHIPILSNEGINDPDSEDTVTLKPVVQGLTRGNVSFTASAITYYPPAKYTGEVLFDYFVTDGLLDSIGLVNISITNTPPRAEDRLIIIDKVIGATHYVLNGENLLLEDGTVDDDGDSLSLIVISGGQKRPQSNEVDIPAFTNEQLVYFMYNDGVADSNVAVATIRFRNLAPVCQNITITANKGQLITLLSSSLCTDVDNDTVSITIMPSDAMGTISVRNSTHIQYTAPQDTSGIWVIPYQGSDRFASSFAFITVNVTNRAPKANSYTWMIDSRRDTNSHSINYISVAKATDADTYDSKRLYISEIKDSTCSGSDVILMQDKKTIQLQRYYSFYGTCSFKVVVTDVDRAFPLTVTKTVTIKVINKGGIVANDLTITKPDQDSFFYMTEAEIMKDDYDPQGGQIHFVQFLEDSETCSRIGFCRSGTSPVRMENGTWRFVQKSDNCQTDRYKYVIQSAADSSVTAAAVLNVVYENCTCQTPLDIMILVDSSASIGGPNFMIMRQFVSAIVSQFDVGSGPEEVQFGVIRFGATTDIISPLSGDKDQVINLIENLPYVGGGTPVLGAIQLAEQEIRLHGRANVSKLILIATDGEPNGPCSCNECRQLYSGTDYEKEMQCKSTVRYPHRDCNTCSIYSPLGCVPCSDIVPISKRINSYRPDDYGNMPPEGFWRILPVGIGQIVQTERAQQLLRDISYDPNQLLLIDWSKLTTIVGAIGAHACNLVTLASNSSMEVRPFEPNVPPSHFCGQIVTLGTRNNAGTFMFVRDGDDKMLYNFNMYNANAPDSRNTLFQIANCGSYGQAITYETSTISLWNLQTQQYVVRSGDQFYGNGDYPVGDNGRFYVKAQGMFASNQPILQYNTVCLQNAESLRTLLAGSLSIDPATGCNSIFNLFWLRGIKYSEIAHRDQLPAANSFPVPIPDYDL